MKKLFILLSLCLCTFSFGLELTEADETLLEATLNTYANILNQKQFTVNYNCPWITNMINTVIAANAVKNGSANFKLPNVIFKRQHTAKGDNYQIDFTQGVSNPQMKAFLTDAQKQAKDMDNFDEMTSGLAMMSLDGLKQLAEILNDNSPRILGRNKHLVTFVVSGLEEELADGMKFTGTTVVIDSNRKTIESAKLNLTGGQTANFSIMHQTLKNAPKGITWVPARITLKHNIQRQLARGMTLPSTIYIMMFGYNFGNPQEGMY